MPTAGDDNGDGLGELGPIKASSVAVTAAKALRNEILRRKDGDMFLGSEDDLIRRLAISRPTFRQAARLLEYEELLTIRRGVGGGFFGRRPSAEVVARMAGIFLLAQGASFSDILRAQQPLHAAALRLIGENTDPGVRGKLRAFLANHGHLQRVTDLPSSIRAVNAFWRLVGETAGNPALTLFLQASQAYGAKSAGLALTTTRLGIYVKGLHDLADALAEGDVARALAISQAQSERMVGWTADDVADQEKAEAPREAGGRS